MKRLVMVALVLAMSLTACGHGGEQEQPSNEQAGATPVYLNAYEVASVVGRHMPTDVGTVEGDQLVSNGKPGFLLYGPYAAFAAGDYTVQFVGKVDSLDAGSTVVIDADSGLGKTEHNKLEVADAGPLPVFNFTLPANVKDLEIRVLVPANGKVRLTSYKIIKK